RPYSHALSSAPVKSDEFAILQLCIYGIGILGIDDRLEPVAALGNEPVRVGDTRSADCPRGPAETEVILSPAVNIVEGPGVVHGDIVELCHRKVRPEGPGLGPVKALIDSAITTNQIVVGVVGIYPHGVVIDMLALPSQASEGFASVVRDHYPD